MKIRIKFSKHGAVRFIGHLDVMRYFQKAMRRAGINIRYSEGFSPHQIMSFASPLGVGLESNGEYLDIEITDDETACPTSEQMTTSLNAVMADGFSVISCRRLPDTAKNAMSLVAAADYTVRFRPGFGPEPASAYFERLGEFLKSPSIEVVKTTKRGETLVDIAPHIMGYKVKNDGIFLRLCAGSAANVKPELVLSAFGKKTGEEYAPAAFSVTREEVYGDQLTPLEAYGEIIE